MADATFLLFHLRSWNPVGLVAAQKVSDLPRDTQL